MKWAHLFYVWIISLLNFTSAQDNETFFEINDFNVTAISDEDMRLPTTLKPLEYVVKINPGDDFQDTFQGHVEIKIKVLEPTSQIILHAAALDAEWLLAEVKEVDPSGEMKTLTVVNLSWSEISQLLTLDLNGTLSVNNTVLFSIGYSGLLVHNALGISQMEYEDENKQKRRIVSTYFQPTGARHAFPCFDEPQLKARFSMHIAKQTNQTALSNMHIYKTTTEGSVQRVEFHKSLPISTYLVAFVVFDFKAIPRSVGKGKLIKVWTRSEVLQNATYAASLASRALKWFEGYFKMSYPLRKLDIVALPSYNVPGMENFGLIITKEEALLTNNKRSRRAWVSTVTAHEVCHQWAGDLVSPKWWNHVWLSEGFATFLTTLALDEIEPNLESTNELVVEKIQDLRITQSVGGDTSLVLHNFQPLRDQLKNTVIYFKGASVLRMMKFFLGDTAFQKGLQLYFKKNKLKSVTQDDFFDAVLTASPKVNETLPAPLSDIMDSWTNKKGLPIIHVGRKQNGSYTVKQEPYYKNSPELEDEFSDNGTKWWIPLSYQSSENLNSAVLKPQEWFPPIGSEFVLNSTSGKDTWFILNTDQMVDSRINYDVALWKDISKVLKQNHSVIRPLSRAQLVDDAFKLLLDGHLQANISMELIVYLRDERSLYPFKSFFNNIAILVGLMGKDKNYPLFQDYISSIIDPVYDALNDLKRKNYSSHKLAKLIFPWTCVFRNQQCVQFAIERFQTWKKTFDNSLFPHSDVEKFLCVVIEFGNESDWDVVFKRAMKGNESFQDSFIYIKPLSCSTSKTIIMKYLNSMLDASNEIKNDVILIMLEYLSKSKLWGDVTWDFIRAHWDDFTRRYPYFNLPVINTQRDYEKVDLILNDLLAQNSTLFGPYVEHEKLRMKKELDYHMLIVNSTSNWLQNTFSRETETTVL